MLQDISNRVIGRKPVRVHPDTFSHKEWEVTNNSRSLNFVSVEKLLHRRVKHFIQQFEESKVVTFGLNAKSGQVDGGKTQIASTRSDLTRWVVNISHHTSSAAHICNLCLRMTGLIILEIEWSINESEVGKKPLSTYLHCQFKQVIVRVVRIIVDTFLDSENLNREDRSFAVSESCLCSKEKLLDSEATFPGCICTIVNRAEWDLSACTGMHGV